MKIKDKVSGEVYEAESWKDWNGRVQYVKKGTNGPIRYADDVEILEEDKPKDTTDWAAFRREAAKDILAALCHTMPINMKEDVRQAINIADELIKQLKEDEK
jgi:hypothetical protein